MPPTIKDVLNNAVYRVSDVERLLDPAQQSFLEFDAELGYLTIDHHVRDGLDDSISEYSFYPHGRHRRMVHLPDAPCRINTYGNSFTLCHQVSDGETWQEILTAHLREPMRNFGVGGHGVYQAQLRAMRAEPIADLSAEYVILNIWYDDHVRNLDSSRWIRSAWSQRESLAARGDAPLPIHGFPWAHVRYDLAAPSTSSGQAGKFVELPGLFKETAELRKLTDADYYYETFKDDPIVHLVVLANGGEAPVDKLEATAEALGIAVDLRDPKTRAAEAKKLHIAYGMKSTVFLLDKFRPWLAAQGKKLMVLLSYGAENIIDLANGVERFDQPIVDYLEANDVTYVDCLAKAMAEFATSSLSVEDYVKRFYIRATGTAVFGHYNPVGNHWFAFSIRDELIDWLDPKPPAYRAEGSLF